MRQALTQGRYLNVVLTVNAILLSAIAYIQLAGGAPWSASAVAQTPPPGTPGGGGIPNAGAQRQEMIGELAALRASVDGMKKQLEGGKMKVVIANVDDIKAAMAAADKGK
jgi:hypothetical protein